jgi:hypothetical protein
MRAIFLLLIGILTLFLTHGFRTAFPRTIGSCKPNSVAQGNKNCIFSSRLTKSFSHSHDLRISESTDDINDFPDEGDKALEMDMAQDLYDELRGDDILLSVEKFLAWDDIQDVLSRGFIDDETMTTIITEVGVSGGLMTFEQFYEMVDLVNQVSIALESPSGEDGMFDDLDMMEADDEVDDGADNSAEAYKWIMDAMMSGMKKRDKDN